MKQLSLSFILSLISFLSYGQSISSVLPSTAWRNEDVTLQVQGLNTLFMGAGYLSMTLVSSVDGSVIHSTGGYALTDEFCQGSFFIQPNATIGAYTLNIPTTNQGVLSKANAITVTNIPKPGLSSISPNHAQNGQSLDVMIVGSNTKFTQLAIGSVVMVKNMSFKANAITVIDDTHLKASFSIPSNIESEIYNLYVDTIGGMYAQLYSSFTVSGVELASVTPSTAKQGETLDLTIRGTRTSFTKASDIAVEFYNAVGPNWRRTILFGTSVIALNDSTLKTTVRFSKNANIDEYYVSVFFDGESYIGDSYMFYLNDDGSPDPEFELAAISPAMAYPGQTIDLTIMGINTHFAQTSSNIDMCLFRQEYGAPQVVHPESFNVLSNTEIIARFMIPQNFDLGVYDFGIVSDVDGYMELRQSFIMNAVGLVENKGLIAKVYPNPVNDKLYIETQRHINSLTILDISGKQTIIDQAEIEQDNTYLVISMDKLGLRKGIYFIRVETDQGVQYQKFIVD